MTDHLPPPSPPARSPEGEPSLGVALSLLIAVRLVVTIGHRLVYPFLPAIARGVGIPFEQAGVLVSARNLAGLATPLVVSTAGRGERRRRLLVAGLVLFAIGAAVTAATGVVGGVLVGFVAMGLAKPAFDVAAQSYLADRTPYHQRARVLGALELTWAGSLLLGAPAVGWLIERLGWEAPFWTIAALGIVAIVALRWTLAHDDVDAERPEPAPLRLDRSGVGLLVALGVTSLAAEITFVVFGAWMELEFGLSLLALGAASTVIALAELSGSASVLAFADRLGKRRTVIVGIGLATLGFAGLPLAGSVTAGLGAFAIGLLGFELTIVAAIPLASELHPGARSRYLAWFVVAIGLGRTIGAATGPALFEGLGIGAPATIAVAMNLVALAIVLGLVVERRGRD